MRRLNLRRPREFVFGPLSLAEYERLLPDGPSFHKLVPLVRNYAGDVLIWDVNLILRRGYRHTGRTLENFCQQAIVVWVQMGYQHKGHTAIRWHLAEKLLKRFQPSGRCTDADDGELARRDGALGIYQC